MGTAQQFSLRWNNYLNHITNAFDSLRTDSDLVDVTLSCEGKKIRAHKMLLSACSTYFRDVFKENPCQHPVIIFRNVSFNDLQALVDFMYQGEVNIIQEQLSSFLTTAELLAVQGLTDGTGKDLAGDKDDDVRETTSVNQDIQGSQKSNSNRSSPSPFYQSSNHRPNSPAAKKRRWNPSTSNLNSQKQTNESERAAQHQSSNDNSDPMELYPMVDHVKEELPEFVDSQAVQLNYDNSGQEPQDPIGGLSMLDHGLPSTSSGNKEESIEIYSGNNEESEDMAGEMTPAELSQVLSKAGPSGENAQDSLQALAATPATPTFQILLDSESSTGAQYVCEICGKSYAHFISLSLHRKCHSGMTTCPVCKKVLSRSYHLKRHLASLHGIDIGQ